ncbi:MAG: sulfatase-like hydrolase/transferase [Williamsia sp.]|nr:sulfatase-like hydrolase/transferase [Williamsia sp.]
MNRKKLVFRCRLIVLFFPLLCLHSGCKSPAKNEASKPNVVIILTDDMGYSDISAFGGTLVSTPHIDSMAARGMRFTQYYSAAPICSPSRCGLLTGMYPARWNFSTYLDNKKHNLNAEQADYLDPAAPSMARFFKNAGYATGHFGKWHLGGGRDVTNAPGFEQYGFDEHVSTYESPDPDPLITATNWIWSFKDSIKRWERTKYFADKALDFLRRHKDQPCFINLWPDDMHTPWVPSRDTLNQEGMEAYKLVLKEYDVQIGRFLQGLHDMGLDNNTIVIFTSDNGPLPSFSGRRDIGLRGSKLSCYEGGTHMPFIITWAGHVPAGRQDTTSVIDGIDLLPSLCRMANIPLPDSYKGDGEDRSAALTGTPSKRNKDMYWEYGRNNIAFRYPEGRDKSPQMAVRSGNWKLLMNADGTGVELYNIGSDRGEKTNVALSHPEIADELKGKLSTWWQGLPKLK